MTFEELPGYLYHPPFRFWVVKDGPHGADPGRVVDDLTASGCEVRGDATAQKVDRRIVPASDEDWGAEYLDKIISVRVVDGLETAIEHINHFEVAKVNTQPR